MPDFLEVFPDFGLPGAWPELKAIAFDESEETKALGIDQLPRRSGPSKAEAPLRKHRRTPMRQDITFTLSLRQACLSKAVDKVVSYRCIAQRL